MKYSYVQTPVLLLAGLLLTAVKYFNLPEKYVANLLDPKILPKQFKFQHDIMKRADLNIISPCADLIGSLILDDFSFLVFNFFLPNDFVSFENLLLILLSRVKRTNTLLKTIPIQLLCLLNPFYLILIKSDLVLIADVIFNFSYFRNFYILAKETSHLPHFNPFWIFFLYMFREFNGFFYDILSLSYFYLGSFFEERLVLFYLFNFNNYKNILMCCKLLDLKIGFIYLLLVAVHNHFITMFNLNGAFNLNFANWIILIFFCIFLIENYNKTKN